MKRIVTVFCAGMLAVSLAHTAAAAPANEYNDRNFNDRVKRESSLTKSGQGAGNKFNDRNFNDRVKPQRFDGWGSKSTSMGGGAPFATGISGAKKARPPSAREHNKPRIVSVREDSTPNIQTKKTDPETLKKQANKPKPPKRELSYRPWDAYNPKEQLPPPPKVR